MGDAPGFRRSLLFKLTFLFFKTHAINPSHPKTNHKIGTDHGSIECLKFNKNRLESSKKGPCEITKAF